MTLGMAGCIRAMCSTHHPMSLVALVIQELRKEGRWAVADGGMSERRRARVLWDRYRTTSGRKWKADFRALMINNYGASGSNASLIVTQAPDLTRRHRAALTSGESVAASIKLASPFWISGDTKDSLRRNVARLRQYIATNALLDPETLSYHLARQANRTLEHHCSRLRRAPRPDVDRQCSQYTLKER